MSAGTDEKLSSKLSLIAVHENCEIRCFSEDLSNEIWRYPAIPKQSEEEARINIRAVHVAHLSLEQARQGILKNREDVLALLDSRNRSDNPGSSITSILALFTNTKSSRGNSCLELRIYGIVNTDLSRDAAMEGSVGGQLQELLRIPIVQPAALADDKQIYFLHASSGMLYQQHHESLSIYNLTGTTPRLEQNLQEGHTIVSFLRFSMSSVLISSQSSISLVDTHFCAIRSSRPLSIEGQTVSSTTLSKKHRRPSTSSIQLLSYFSPSDIAVALQGRNLLTFNVSKIPSTEASSQKRLRDGSLISFIGRGIAVSNQSIPPTEVASIAPKAFGTYLPPSQTGDEWQKTMALFDKYVLEGNEKEFERLAVIELGISPTNVLDVSSPFTAPDGKLTGPRWQQQSHINRTKVSYVLSKIFLPVFSDNSADSVYGEEINLKIGLFPSQVIRWLVDQAYLSTRQVEVYLKQAGTISSTVALQSGAMIQALATFDPSLETLYSIFGAYNVLSAREIITAIRPAIELSKRFNKDPNNLQQITNAGENPPDQTTLRNELTNGESQQSHQSPPNGGSSAYVTTCVLQTCLTRLDGYHDAEIIKSLKEVLPQHDMISLIDYLRLTLARGGWLSHYVDDGSLSKNNLGESENQIHIAVKLLNCIVDSLGTGGWLSGTNDLLQNGDTIAYMRAEVSAALEGIEESAYLKSLLGEVLLFSKTALPSTRSKALQIDQSQSEPSLHKQIPMRNPAAVKPVTVPLKDAAANILPLGLKAPQDISLTKVGSGGEIQKRSMRDVGRLKSRKVGKYTFERIII